MKILNYSLYLCLIIIVAAIQECKCQSFTVRQIPNEIEHEFKVTKQERLYILKKLKKPYDLTQSLPLGFVKDGSEDYTDLIQQGIDAHEEVIFPDFPLLINPKGITINSNSRIYFPENSHLLLKSNGLLGYQVLRIHNVKNVDLYFPRVIGDRDTHLVSRAAWGFGISIRGSENISVHNPHVSKCMGDGIYVGFLKKPAKNILIVNAISNNNRRNGLSITSAVDVKIEGGVFGNTNGQGPGCGIDIEPNGNNDEIKGIYLNDVTTFNNMNWGILINLVNLRKGPNLKLVEINITSHKDIYSAYGMGMWLTKKGKNGKGVTGKINIVSSTWADNKIGGFNYFHNDEHALKVQFQDPKISKDKKLLIKDINDIKNLYSNDPNVSITR